MQIKKIKNLTSDVNKRATLLHYNYNKQMEAASNRYGVVSDPEDLLNPELDDEAAVVAAAAASAIPFRQDKQQYDDDIEELRALVVPGRVRDMHSASLGGKKLRSSK